MFATNGYQILGNNVFYNSGILNEAGFQLVEADAQTFQILENGVAGVTYVNYAKDKNHVYYNGTIMQNADAKTFERLDSFHAKDRQHIFYSQYVLSEDPNHFRFLGSGYSRDRKHIYSGDYPISDSPDTFERFEGFARDEHGIIIGIHRLENADSKSFQYVGSDYYRDKNHVFLIESDRKCVISEADAATFKVISQYYTKDKNKVFWRGEPLSNADPTKFQVFSEEMNCSHDGKHAYRQNHLIPNVDPNKFPKGKRCRYCNEENVMFDD